MRKTKKRATRWCALSWGLGALACLGLLGCPAEQSGNSTKFDGTKSVKLRTFREAPSLLKARVVPTAALRPIQERMPPGNFGQLVIPAGNGKFQALETRQLNVRVQVQGRMARTEVEQVFFNTTNRQTEGTYTFRLPYGAAITRLAMEVNGKLVEGELVERTRARAIYRSIVRSMKDPALLEWQGGSRFRTQIFPIPARSTKRILLGYDHVLRGEVGHVDYVYHLPLAGKGPKVGLFSFSLEALGMPKTRVTPYDAVQKVDAKAKLMQVSYQAKQFKSRGQFVVRMAHQKRRGTLFAGEVKKQNYGLLEIPLALGKPRALYKHRVFLIDTSAGMRTRGLRKAVEVCQELLKNLPSDAKFGVVAGDVHARLFRDKLAEQGAVAEAIAFLEKQSPRGGTHLERLLKAAIRLAGDKAEIVYIGDGMPSLGAMDADLLAGILKKSAGSKSLRISAIGLGPNPDMGLLRQVALKTGGRAVRLQVGERAEKAVASLLSLLKRPQLTDIKVIAKGMKEVQRFHQGSVASGEALLIAGRMTKPAVRVEIQGKIDGKKAYSFKEVFEPETQTSKPMAPAFWARFQIANLEKKAQQRPKIISLSKNFGVMSRYTSYLVLENDAAYKKYQIARRKQAQKNKGKRAIEQGLVRNPTRKRAAKKDRAARIRDWMGSKAGGSGSAPRTTGNRELRYAPADGMRMRKKGRRSAPAGSPRLEMPSPSAEPARPEPAPVESKEMRAGVNLKSRPRRSMRRLKRKLEVQKHGSKVRVFLRSKPSGAKVYQEGRLLGVTPLRFFLSRGQRVTLTLKKTCYKPYKWIVKPQGARLGKTIRLVKDSRQSCPKGAWLWRPSRAQKACDRPPLSRKTRWNRARRRWVAQAETKKAILEARKTLKKAPTVWDHHARLVALLVRDHQKKEALAAVQDWRRYAPENAELIHKESKLLRDLGARKEALRVLSELVEFSPQHYGKRVQYARALEKQGVVSKACEQLAQAVHLNPARRETFRSMMGLARRHKGQEYKEIVRACIVKGVSRLPVVRDVSLVMFWDDPQADVDLHVHEPDGSHVYYRKRESRQGGTLYYDIMDGLGPEVYVLGSAKPGKYKISIVYFTGRSKVLTGKLVVLRNAGSAEETRKMYSFQLYKKDGKKEVHITTLLHKTRASK